MGDENTSTIKHVGVPRSLFKNLKFFNIEASPPLIGNYLKQFYYGNKMLLIVHIRYLYIYSYGIDQAVQSTKHHNSYFLGVNVHSLSNTYLFSL